MKSYLPFFNLRSFCFTSLNTLGILAEASGVLTLTGSGFGTDSSKTDVNIGSYVCKVSAQTDTSITCSYDPIPAGTYTVTLTTKDGKFHYIYYTKDLEL